MPMFTVKHIEVKSLPMSGERKIACLKGYLLLVPYVAAINTEIIRLRNR